MGIHSMTSVLFSLSLSLPFHLPLSLSLSLPHSGLRATFKEVGEKCLWMAQVYQDLEKQDAT